MTRADLQAAGYLAMYANSDLHAHGWQIRHWLHVATRHHAIEYIPRRAGKCASSAPTDGAIIVTTYAEQVAFHRAIGVGIVPPGETWTDSGEGIDQGWLF